MQQTAAQLIQGKCASSDMIVLYANCKTPVSNLVSYCGLMQFHCEPNYCTVAAAHGSSLLQTLSPPSCFRTESIHQPYRGCLPED